MCLLPKVWPPMPNSASSLYSAISPNSTYFCAFLDTSVDWFTTCTKPNHSLLCLVNTKHQIIWVFLCEKKIINNLNVWPLTFKLMWNHIKRDKKKSCLINNCFCLHNLHKGYGINHLYKFIILFIASYKTKLISFCD